MWFKVIRGQQFWYNRKPVCNFLLDNKSSHPISHRFQVIADHWSNSHCQYWVSLINTLVHREPPNSGLWNLIARNWRYHSMVRCKMYFRYLEALKRGSKVWQTDGRTEWPLATASSNIVRCCNNPYPGACKQNQTEMFSDHDKTSPSIVAVSALSAAHSMLAVQQQKRLCRQFVDVSMARQGCHMMRRVV